MNDKPTIPRVTRRRLPRDPRDCEKENLASMVARQPGLAKELAGFAAYVKMVQPELGAAMAEQVRRLTGP